MATVLAVALCLVSGGCGGGPAEPEPAGPLADALGEVSGGESAIGSQGVGWTDPRLARAAGVDAGLMADALGPNAGTVIEAAPALRRRFGLDPLSASRLVSVGGSYAFGLRLDGIDGSRLRDALAGDAGGSIRQGEGVELEDVGDYAEVPAPLLRAQVFGLGARDAFGPSLVVLAISDTARDSLLGLGERLLDQPIYRAAADCLGDVVAARMIPDKLLISVELGVDLVAVGVGGVREVLCLLGGSSARAAEIAGSLRGGLAADAREPRTGQRMGELVRDVQVTSATYEGIEVVRASVVPAPGQARDFVFDAIGRGTIPLLINGR